MLIALGGSAGRRERWSFLAAGLDGQGFARFFFLTTSAECVYSALS